PSISVLDPLEDARRPHAGADTHGQHAVLQISPAQSMYDGRRPYGARGTQGMTQGNGAAQRIDDVRVQSQVAYDRQRLRRKRFIQLYPADLIQPQAGQLQGMGDGFLGSDSHDFRRYAFNREGHESRQG